MKIQQTRTYSLFSRDDTNRPITSRDSSRLAKLTASMKKYGFLQCFPLWVIRIGDKHAEVQFRVKDGQHRLHVAEKLELPVSYLEYDRDDVVIAHAAAGQSAWSLHDHVSSYASQGNRDYQTLLSFQQEHNLPIGAAVSILYGYGGLSTSVADKLKTGSFEVRDMRGANRIVALLDELRKHVDWAANTGSLTALSQFIRVREFEDDQFIKRIASYPHMLSKQPTVELFSKMYDALYNYNSRLKIPLAFLAKQEATRRGDVGERSRNRVAEGRGGKGDIKPIPAE